MTELLQCKWAGALRAPLKIARCYSQWTGSHYDTRELIDGDIAIHFAECSINPRWQHLLLATGIYCVHINVTTAYFRTLRND